MPHCSADSASLYRALQALESEGAVSGTWEIAAAGPPRKVYHLTDQGNSMLSEFAKDIEKRRENFNFFLDRYRRQHD